MAILGKERWEDWEVIYEGISGLSLLYEGDPASRGMNAYLKAFKGLVEDIFRAIDEGRPVVWHNCGMSPELIRALEGDVQPCPIEIVTVLQDLVGDVQYTIELIDNAEAHGLPSSVCSIDKAGVGAAIKGILPNPNCLVFHNTPCDSQVAAAQVMAELTGAPLYFVDIPYLAGDREVKHVAKQLKEQIPFLEKYTGRKFSWDRLRQVCEYNNKMTEKLLEWSEWRKTIPCPQVSKVAGLLVPLLVAFSGSPTAVFVAEELAREAKERGSAGEAAVEGGEKIRAIWYQDPLWFDLSFYDWMESDLKMVVPMDLFGYFAPEGYIDTSTPESMLEGLAVKYLRIMPMSRQFKGPVDDYFIGDYLRLCSEYKADCGIFAGHIACKHGWGGIGLMKEASQEAGIPLLVFEFDMFDPRVTSSEALKAEFRSFVDNIVLPRIEFRTE
jgi:benzoyl-CoA reductase/2-hydroxyglutaryl-CoA dehydratase subunit BcrC/BadD/HgdB